MLSALLQSNQIQDNAGRDPQAPPQFTAGWLLGVSFIDKRDEIIDCYEPNDDLMNAQYDAMEAYIADDKATGDEKMAQVKKLAKKAYASCEKTVPELFEWYQK